MKARFFSTVVRPLGYATECFSSPPSPHHGPRGGGFPSRHTRKIGVQTPNPLRACISSSGKRPLASSPALLNTPLPPIPPAYKHPPQPPPVVCGKCCAVYRHAAANMSPPPFCCTLLVLPPLPPSVYTALFQTVTLPLSSHIRRGRDISLRPCPLE